LILILVLIFLFFDFKNGLLLDECGLGKGFVTRVFSFSLVEINKSLDFRIVPSVVIKSLASFSIATAICKRPSHQ